MTFEVEINGRFHVVTIEASGPVDETGGCVVTVQQGDPDGDMVGSPADVMRVDVRRTDLGLSLVYAHDGRSVDAAITERPGGETLVQLPHVDIPVLIDGRRYRRRGAEAEGSGEQRITAPMPGRVLRVLVGVGDAVTAGQAVVVIEAMKMENELKSLRAGRVREVCVTEASSVESGRLLMVVE